jgi:hypothetical protein
MTRGDKGGKSKGSGIRCVAANCGNTNADGVSLRAAGVEGISDCVELELLGVVVSIGVGAWIVGYATEVKVTLFGLTPICCQFYICSK